MKLPTSNTEVPISRATLDKTALRYWHVIRNLILAGPTLPVRFWFAISSIGWAIELGIDDRPDTAYLILFKLVPVMANPHYFWSSLFIVHAVMLLKGMTGRYGIISLFLEAILGWILWICVCGSYLISESHPGAVSSGLLIATWLLVRYPTHSKASRG